MSVDPAATPQSRGRTRQRTRTLTVPRTRGAISGLLLILLGAWGALVPFIGPYFDYSYGSDRTWVWSHARLWLEVLPGAAAVLGGLLVLTSVNRLVGSFGGWLAAAAGAWFVIGRSLAAPWRIGDVGSPVKTGDGARAAADLGYFYGLGAVILFLAAFALGRLAVVAVRDVRAVERQEAAAAELEQRRQAEIAREAEAQREREAQREAERSRTVERGRTADEGRTADLAGQPRTADQARIEDGAGAHSRAAQSESDHPSDYPATGRSYPAAPSAPDEPPAQR